VPANNSADALLVLYPSIDLNRQSTRRGIGGCGKSGRSVNKTPMYDLRIEDCGRGHHQ